MYVYMGGSGLLQSTVLFFLDSSRPWALSWFYGITHNKEYFSEELLLQNASLD